jgi:hypothetical protein
MKDKIYIGEVLYEVLPANTVIKIGTVPKRYMNIKMKMPMM